MWRSEMDGDAGAVRRRAGPVEPRTTSSGSKNSSSSGTGLPAIWPTRSSMTIRPIGSIGWRTVVRGGSVQFMSAESSKPTTDTSPGHAQPRPPGGADRAKRHRVARADDPGDLALSRRVAAVWAASSE